MTHLTFGMLCVEEFFFFLIDFELLRTLTNIFCRRAFGCIVYELIKMRKLFEGDLAKLKHTICSFDTRQLDESNQIIDTPVLLALCKR